MRHLSLALLFIAATSFAQQADDAEYTRQIRQFTTGPQFTTEMVDQTREAVQRERELS